MQKSPISTCTKQADPSTRSWAILSENVAKVMAKIESDNRLRTLNPPLPEGAIDLTHNDYLGLRHDLDFISEIDSSCQNLPVGSGGSRLLGGEHPIFQVLEESFAEFKGSEDSIYYPSGYAANEAICRALYGKGVAFFSDQLNHASIIDGIRIAKVPGHKKFKFAHNDLADLETKLSQSPFELNIVITESVFSMDGDRAPLKLIKNLCDRYNGLLVVDEAHALGVYGSKGQGCLEENGNDAKEIITINPCGKGLGASGALITCPSWFKTYLINTSRGFIYTTAPSPRTASSLIASIKYTSKLHHRRQILRAWSEDLRQHLRSLGFAIGSANSHIFPIIFGDEHRALAAEQFLKNKLIFCKAIRPPTVPPESSRLRLSLHAGLTEMQFNHIKSALKELSYGL